MDKKRSLFIFIEFAVVIAFLVAPIIYFWHRGIINSGHVVKLQSPFGVDNSFSRTEDYEGEPCVAYRGGSFMAMESYRVPFFSDRMRDANLIRVAYVPEDAGHLKESECHLGTAFRTQVNTWFGWEEGAVFVAISLSKTGEEERDVR